LFADTGSEVHCVTVLARETLAKHPAFLYRLIRQPSC